MIALAILLALTGNVAAQPVAAVREIANTEEAMWRELEELRARQSWLEQRLSDTELRLKAIQARSPTLLSQPDLDDRPRFRFGRGSGFAFTSANGDSEVRFRITLHIDGRSYLGDNQASPDTFLMRRVRPFVEGTLWGFVDFRLMPDFPQGQAVLDDAWIELHPWRWLRLRGGRFMVPLGLEWLQSDSTIMLVERSLATDLVPYRDLGAMLSGDVGGGTVAYKLALLNGAPDGGNGPDIDAQTDKDYVFRLFLRPLASTRLGESANLGFGAAGSYGEVNGTAQQPSLPIYHSTGQQTIFTYLGDPMAPVVAAGARWRATPQGYLYVGPVGMLAEYVVSSQRVQRMTTAADLEHRAWNVTMSFVLTLERSSYEGVVPAHPIDFRHRNFGAFELVGRYSELHLDPAAFPVFADSTVSVQSAREVAGGLNWYLTDYVRIMLSYEHTEFNAGAVRGNRPPEDGLLGRLQVAL